MERSKRKLALVGLGGVLGIMGLSGPLQHSGIIPESAVGNLSISMLKAARGTLVKEANASCGVDLGDVGSIGNPFSGFGGGLGSMGAPASHAGSGTNPGIEGGVGGGVGGGGAGLAPLAATQGASYHSPEDEQSDDRKPQDDSNDADLSCKPDDAACKKQRTASQSPPKPST